MSDCLLIVMCLCNKLLKAVFKPGACQPKAGTLGFLKLRLSRKLVCACVCVCVCVCMCVSVSVSVCP